MLPLVKVRLRIAGLGLGFFALFGGMIGPAARFFPVNWLNQEMFLHLTGIPISLFRGLCGIAMTYGFGRALGVVSTEVELWLESVERIQALDRERERIGRELHDGTIQSIYAAGLMLEGARYSIATEPEAARSLTILPESRPEFYDFDLFSNVQHVPELEDRSLTDLTYTVFDMETTGLKPAEGDEIVSIGGFRVVNCRLLRDEFFEQLIDPRRSIPWTSVKIHGIHPEMLIGQPFIEQVLPQFHQFAEDTVLVAHNAAFDMLFLQLKEAQTGVKFVNPVLDTLLLSAVVHASHENHDLEAISQRLGVRILGRHTALGDAVATGEIFLKMLPLLAQKGIYTLKDALAASQKTYYARQKF